ncbi:MAG TPA: glutamate-1-semialdehyde 2,1-aminomutase [Gaiellaceae bacterium]|jgi:glutamate-1-semialdehyde 2,1-aminomutase
MSGASDWPVPSERSRELYERALRVTPGGVHGEGRIARPFPLFMTRGSGSHVWDVDGNEFVDYHAGFGAVLLGHNHPEVAEAVRQGIETHAPMFAAASDLEVELAERLVELVPSAEKVIFACTGSEATFHAIRLARGVTGREKVLKFEGHYHGWHDYVAWSAHFDAGGSPLRDGVATPIPASAGMPKAIEDLVVVCEYNDADGVEAAIGRNGSELAAVIVEPIFFNAGVIPPEPGFLERIRELCTEREIVLIFDEVISGFRCGLGGGQELVGVTPDLTTMGKAIANGFPISTVVGRADLMDEFLPAGTVLFAGTFTAQPATVSAALACTGYLQAHPVHEEIERLGQRLEDGIANAIAETGVDAQVQRVASVWALYFTSTRVRRYRDLATFVATKENALHDAYRRFMLEQGVYIHPHYMLRGYLTAAHSEEDVDRTVAATRDFLEANRGALGA